jgi:hypothetical protein
MERTQGDITPLAVDTASSQAIDFYTHRSGHETGQYCPRRRYLAYHHLGTGVNLFPPIYFDIGTAVHAGLAYLMLSTNEAFDRPDDLAFRENVANLAVALSIDYFRKTPVYQTLDQFSRSEQETLIAGLLWAFYYRAWPAFINKFEVLFVEESSEDVVEYSSGDQLHRLHTLSRPDVIVRDRHTLEVVAINWKTINSITDERRENITNSLQVNLEAYYAERLFDRYMMEQWVPTMPAGLRGNALAEHMQAELIAYQSQPREINYTQIVYLVKGPRVLTLPDGTEVSTDLEDTYTDEMKTWRQDSWLCYQYVNLGDDGPKGRSRKTAEEFPPVAWSTRYYKPDNVSYNLLGAAYKKQPIWETESVGPDSMIQRWVARLNEGGVFPSTMKDQRNPVNPLDKVVVFEQPIYRNETRQRRLREQFIEDEIRINSRLVDLQVNYCGDNPPEGDLEDGLDKLFIQHLISCRKPTRCEFDRVCNNPQGGTVAELVQIVEGGIWQRRTPHHRAERIAFGLGNTDTLEE